MNYQETLERIYTSVLPTIGEGEQAQYIPTLAAVRGDQLGACLTTTDGCQYAVGDADTRFAIQSISKVLALAMAVGLDAEAVWSRVGREPSGTAFNSLVQLEYEQGRPRNPFINAGAIVVADILMERLDHPKHDFLRFVRSLAKSPTIAYNEEAAHSEQTCAYRNAAIAYLLKCHGNIQGDISEVLRFYFLMCSIEMSCRELSQAFLPFADHRHPFDFMGVTLTASQVKRINAVMQTCGFYDQAGEFAYRVGLPGKSGVGGGIAAVCPGYYSVATWSPRLNSCGNSVAGMKMLELLTTDTKESIF